MGFRGSPTSDLDDSFVLVSKELEVNALDVTFPVPVPYADPPGSTRGTLSLEGVEDTPAGGAVTKSGIFSYMSTHKSHQDGGKNDASLGARSGGGSGGIKTSSPSNLSRGDISPVEGRDASAYERGLAGWSYSARPTQMMLGMRGRCPQLICGSSPS